MSYFNTIVPSRLIGKLSDLGVKIALCDRILDFQMDLLQVVRVDNRTSFPLSKGAPQGLILSPLLYSLYSRDCVATKREVCG